MAKNVVTLAKTRFVKHNFVIFQPKETREIGCQTEPVSTKHAAGQANIKPPRRSKATQARPPNRSVSCDTGMLVADPEAVAIPEVPVASSTPHKRTRYEVSTDDSSYQLDVTNSTMNHTSNSDDMAPYAVTKYIVHEDKLMELFKRCPVCTRSCEITKNVIGTLLQVKQSCSHCDYVHQWSSQPMVNNIPAGNLQLCAAVLFTGSSFVQISKFMDAFKIQGISETTFHKHQSKLLFPTIYWQWKQNQEHLIRDSLAGGDVTLGGDMRADSPGHSAKYGSYTMMDLTLNKSNEVGNSVRMEKEGFERSLSFLEDKGVVVKAVVTDRHTGVQKFLREQRPGISHYFDPWHMGKGIGKKIDAMAKMRRTQEVGPWRKSVVNHLYWSASTSASGQEVVAKWASIANHLQNVHTHENPLLPSCLHQPLVEEQARHWLKPSTAACEQLTAVLLAPRLLKDMEKISPQHHT
ncbi:uncharacterized protein LOC115593026 [Sparus aurata]|uniref:uncharacterized protein LOC115593026 n=1 Tax=Sparus aurata TaxID=8175 RepID=UPI0011C0F518|nr:uncharacterized protein LOC115593026 [Sparus aurata]